MHEDALLHRHSYDAAHCPAGIREFKHLEIDIQRWLHQVENHVANMRHDRAEIILGYSDDLPATVAYAENEDAAAAVGEGHETVREILGLRPLDLPSCEDHFLEFQVAVLSQANFTKEFLGSATHG